MIEQTQPIYPAETKQIDLPLGKLTLNIHAGDYAADDLFGFAARRNPKRAFLFVSKVLGKHIPVSPNRMRQTMHDLAKRIPIDLPAPIVVIGMAETAVSLSAGVHREYCALREQALGQHSDKKADDVLFLCTTRHPVNEEIWVNFAEEHSHATQQVLHYPREAQHQALLKEARSLILVDDEATTGKTFANLVNALQSSGQGLPKLEHIVAATLTDWSDGQLAQHLQKLPANVQAVSLLSGRWQWQGNDQPPPEMPNVDVLGTGEWQPNAAFNWGRAGVTQHSLAEQVQKIPLPAINIEQRVLVLGTGEFMWQPFLFAEALQQRYQDLAVAVYFSSTTRSPIALGESIQYRYSFSDNYGQGIANYLYNVEPTQYDHILICSEVPAELVDQRLLAELKSASINTSVTIVSFAL
jgi:hypothetical protein